MELPAALKTKIERVWGVQGSEWVDRFPEILRVACERWNLSELEPFPNLSYHFVAAGRMDVREVAIKLGVPEPEFFQEAAALRAFGGNTCVKLIDYAPDVAAMVLERVNPGQSLESTWREELDDIQTKVIAQSMADLVTTGETPEIIAPFALSRFAHGDVQVGAVPGA